MNEHRDIQHNIRAHDDVADRYDDEHGEIFNAVEQDRLAAILSEAVMLIESDSDQRVALDYGCGSGNLTRHLLDQGLHVDSADISQRFLEIISERFGSTGVSNTIHLNGRDLSNIPDGQYDFVATYSVLHHVPDYLAAIREMIRVLKPGGVLYLDHEPAPSVWDSENTIYHEYLERVRPPVEQISPFQKMLRLMNPTTLRTEFRNFMDFRVRRALNPRYSPEGDIHVWSDDHVDWDRISGVIEESGCEVVLERDYLVYKRGYDEGVYREYADRCADVRVLVGRKMGEQ